VPPPGGTVLDKPVVIPANEKTDDPIALGIGGVVLGARLEGLPGPSGVEPHYHPFLSVDRPDLELLYRMGTSEEEPAETLFESGGVWTLHRLRDGRYRFDLNSDVMGEEPYAQAIVDPDLQRGEVLLRTLDGHLSDGAIHPFVYPLDEVLTMTILSRRRGLLVHAAGIDDRGRGVMFPGVSGAGKSTLSKVWKKDGGARVLTDDRTIVRFDDGAPVIHGTPWHGEAALSSPSSARLEGLFFLEQASVNEAVPVTPAEAATELLARSFPTWWDHEGVAWALEAADMLTSCTPAYRLRFRPDMGAVETVREVLDVL